jgi:asparagine synthase (glutamine-hydrolysing)
VSQDAHVATVATNGLTPLEVATGVLLGRAPDRAPARSEAAGPAIHVLERALLAALQRPPCLVSFSGGRDSSALLALAVRVARREGLPEPVPATEIFPAVSESEETEWQRLVIDHLALREWSRISFDDELDIVGPVARSLITSYGLMYPYNLHLHAPLIDAASGGSLVTGLGGDEVLAPGSRQLAVLTGRVRPRPRDLLRLGFEAAPRRLQRAIFERRPGISFPWLHPAADRALHSAWSGDSLRFPLRWDGRLREWRRSRYVQVTLDFFARLGARANVRIVSPFTDLEFVGAFAREGGFRGFPSRAAAMEALFPPILPEALSRRQSKASFDAVLWNRHTRSFVEPLSPDELRPALAALGLEPLVDPQALLAHWRDAQPEPNSYLLLQACWLALGEPERSGGGGP